ncbi:MAG: hypothetical protein WC892_07140, partial [Patescibacteria group bacterium]
GTVNPTSFRLQVAGHVGPSSTNAYDLGSASSSWRDIYASGTASLANVSSTNIYASGYVSTTNLYVNGTSFGNAFVQGGNSFGATGTLGTNDAYNLDFETNNTSRLTILSGGNVGIGTVNPTAKLSVDTGYVQVNNGYGLISKESSQSYVQMNTITILQGQLETDINTYSGALGQGGSGAIVFKPLGTERMRIDSTGNVGIGTINPSWFRLQVAGNVGPSSTNAYDLGSASSSWRDIYASGTASLANVSSTNIYASGYVSTTNLYVSGGGSGNVFVQGGNSFSTTGTLGTKDAYNLNLITNNTSRLTVLSGGNVGIGTVNPSYALDVYGGSLAVRSGNALRLFNADNSSQAAISNDGGVSATTLNFYTTAASAMTLTGANKVGIGATSPANRLTVAGIASYPDSDIGFTATTTGSAANWTIGTDHSDGGKFKISSSTALGTSDRFVIDGKGYVGIGTATPGQALTVNGSIAVNNQIQWSNADGPGDAYLAVDSGRTLRWRNWDSSNPNWSVVTFETGKGIFNTSLGVGTINPTSFMLQVAGNVGPSSTNAYDLGSAALSWKDIYASGTVYGGDALFSGNVTSTKNNLALYSTSTDRFFRMNMLADGTATLQATAGLTISSILSSAVQFGNNVIPVGNNSKDLGVFGTAWRDIYASGTASLANVSSTNIYASGYVSTTNLYVSGGGSGNVFVQGGNSFSTTGTLGTKDAYNLNLITNNTSRLTVLSGGNVGIGTTNPGAKLEVNGIGQDNIRIVRTNSVEFPLSFYNGATQMAYFDTYGTTWGSIGNGAVAIKSGTGNFTLNQNNVNVLMSEGTGAIVNTLYLKTGNVGVGTINPTSFMLQVAGNVGPSSTNSYDLGSAALSWRDIYASGTASLANVSSTNIYASGYVSTTNLYVSGGGSGNVFVQGGNSFGTTGTLGTKDAYNLNLITNNTSRLTVLSGGNVGIGTVNPTTALHVAGAYPFLLFEDTSSPSFMAFRGDARMFFDSNSTYVIASQPNASKGTASGETNRLSISGSTGNIGIGIGNTTPYAFKLTVAGNVGPSSTNAYDLGSAALSWKNIYASGTASLAIVSSTNIYASANTLTVGKDGVAMEATTTNLMVNDLETDLTGIASDGTNTRTISTDYALFGNSSLKWEFTTGSQNVYTTILKSVSSTVFTGTIYARKADGTAITNALMYIYAGADSGSVATENTYIGNGWYKLTGTRTVLSGAPTLFGLTNLPTSTAIYLEGWQLEAKGSGTKYVQNDRLEGDVVAQNRFQTLGAGSSFIRYGSLGVGTDNSYLFKITSAGHIGPSSTNSYDLGAAAMSWRDIYASGTARLGSVSTTNIYASGYVSTTNLFVSGGGSGNVFVQGGNSFGTAGTLGTKDANSLNLITNNTSRMTILSDGKVGIGTTPAATLDVRTADAGVGTRTLVGIFGRTGAAPDATERAAGFVFSDGNNPTFTAGIAGIRQNSNADYNGALGFYVNNGGAAATLSGLTEVMRINNSGNVGIGTVNPSWFRLQVAGHVGPSSTNAYDLGSASSSWRDVYASGTAQLAKVAISAGNSAAPSLFFATDTDTGFSSPALGNLDISTDGALRARISSGGFQVGPTLYATGNNLTDIGRADISWKDIYASGTARLGSVSTTNLDASGYVSTTNLFVSGGGSGNVFVQGGNSFATTGTLGTKDAYNLDLITNNTSKLTILSGGNVGIGTVNPTRKLDVAGDIQISGSGATIYGPGGTYWMGLNASTGNLYSFSLNRSGGNVAYPDFFGGSGGLVLGATVAGTGIISLNTTGNVTPTMYLNGSGNVGIGTVNPSWFRLQVAGNVGPSSTNAYDLGSASSSWRDIYASGTATLANVSSTNIYASGYVSTTNLFVSGGGAGNVFVQGGNTFGTTGTLGTKDANNLSFKTNNTSRLTILSGGNVGVGTVNPSQLFTVAADDVGYIKIQGGTSGAPSRRAILELAGSDGGRARGILSTLSGAETWFSGTPYNGIGYTLGYGSAQAEYLANSKLYVMTTGNVGIGTTAPANKLTINDNGGDTADADLGFNVTTTAGGTSSWAIGADKTDQGKFKISSSTVLGTSDRLVIDGNGYVGIGTASPNTPLEVRTANDGSKTDELTVRNYGTAANTGEAIIFRNYYRNARITGFSSPGVAFGGSLQLQTHIDGNDNDTVGDWTTGILIDNTGSVGINNTSPSYKLDLTGGQRIAGSLNITDAGDLVTNGTFNTDIIGWTDSSQVPESIAWNAGGWMDVISSGVGYARADQQITTVNGVRYKITFTVGGFLTYTMLQVGTVQGGSQLLSAGYAADGVWTAGTKTYYFTATGATTWMRFASGGGTSTVDTVSVTGGNLFAAGNVGIGMLNPTSFKLQVAGNVGPSSTNAYDLGSAALSWKDIYASGTASLANVSSTNIYASGYVSTTNLYVNGLSLGSAFVQNGNSFGTTGTLGTNDANNLSLETNNTSRLTILSGGNVGIGTVNPGMKMDIVGLSGLPVESGAVQNGALRLGIGVVGDNVLDFGVQAASPFASWIQSTNKGSLVNTYPLLLNPNGGNIGIGTRYAASFALQVAGSVGPSSTNAYDLGSAALSWKDIYASGTATLANVSSTNIYASGYVSTTNLYVNGTSFGNAFVQNGNSFGTTGTLGTNDANNLSFETNNANRLTILSDGKVGIGTVNPGYPLEVVGNVKIAQSANQYVIFNNVGASAMTDFVTGGTGFAFSRPSDGAANLSGFYNYQDAGGLGRMALASRGDIVFAAGGASTYDQSPERMRITSSGNVGIGATVPANRLTLTASGTLTSDADLGFNVTSTDGGTQSWTIGADKTDQGKFKISSSTV